MIFLYIAIAMLSVTLFEVNSDFGGKETQKHSIHLTSCIPSDDDDKNYPTNINKTQNV